MDGLPIIYTGSQGVPYHVTYGRSNLVTDIDLVASTLFMATRYEESLGVEYHDRHRRYPAIASLAYREGFLDRPVVHEYAEVLWSWLKYLEPGLERSPRWGQNTWAACITHDVDSLRRYSYPPLNTMAKAIKDGEPGRSLGILREYVRVISGRQPDPYDTIDYLVTQEIEHGLTPTFFLMAGPYGLKNFRRQDYRLNDPKVRRILRTLTSHGCEIALHSSYDAFDNLELLHQEKAALMEAAGEDIAGMRQHFLRFKAPDSWRLWEQAGFSYDASLGYAEQEGFRSGLCIPYHPFDVWENRELALWEVPLTVMEGSLFEYQQMEAEAVTQRLRKMIDRVIGVGGVFVALWHNSFLDDRVYPGSRTVYRQMLQDIAGKQPLGLSISQTIERVSR
jgi:hypothetical protein